MNFSTHQIDEDFIRRWDRWKLIEMEHPYVQSINVKLCKSERCRDISYMVLTDCSDNDTAHSMINEVTHHLMKCFSTIDSVNNNSSCVELVDTDPVLIELEKQKRELFIRTGNPDRNLKPYNMTNFDYQTITYEFFKDNVPTELYSDYLICEVQYRDRILHLSQDIHDKFVKREITGDEQLLRCFMTTLLLFNLTFEQLKTFVVVNNNKITKSHFDELLENITKTEEEQLQYNRIMYHLTMRRRDNSDYCDNLYPLYEVIDFDVVRTRFYKALFIWASLG